MIFVGQRGSVVSRQHQLDVLSTGSLVFAVALLFAGCASQQVTAGPVHAQFALRHPV